jgi:hypothetical protein
MAPRDPLKTCKRPLFAGDPWTSLGGERRPRVGGEYIREDIPVSSGTVQITDLSSERLAARVALAFESQVIEVSQGGTKKRRRMPRSGHGRRCTGGR